MNVEAKLIGSAEDYTAALKEIDTLMMAKSGTLEGERLSILADLIQAYESEHFPIE